MDMPDTPQPQRFTFGTLVTSAANHNGGRIGTAGLNDHQLRLLVANLEGQLEQTLVDLRVLVEKARIEGERAGLEQARRELPGCVLAATDAIQSSIEQLGETVERRFEAVVRDSASLALATGEFLAGQALRTAPLGPVSTAISELLGEMHQLQTIDVEVHPTLVEPLQSNFPRADEASRKACEINIYGNAEISLGDALLSWGAGGLKIDGPTRRATMAETLAVILPDDAEFEA